MATTLEGGLLLLDAWQDLRKAARAFQIAGNDDMAADCKRIADCLMVMAEAAKERARKAA